MSLENQGQSRPDDLVKKIAEKEQEILDKKGETKEETGKQTKIDLIDENAVEKKLQKIEKRIEPFSDEFKKPIQDKVQEVEDRWKKEIDQIDSEGGE